MDCGGDAPLYVDNRPSVVKFEAPGIGRYGYRKNDVAQRIGTEAVFAFVQPEKPGNGKPARVGLQVRLIVVAPFLDLGAIGSVVRSQCKRRKARRDT